VFSLHDAPKARGCEVWRAEEDESNG
jgi:hypothetical protein